MYGTADRMSNELGMNKFTTILLFSDLSSTK